MRPWIAFFSQTGSEIYNLSNSLGIYPDTIVTNKQDLTAVNKDLIKLIEFREHKLNKSILHRISAKPTVSEYRAILQQHVDPLITLHGYLRIIPREICEEYEIYNLHPGMIDKYPELKGFNPQERAFRGNYKLAGCVLHRVVAEVDAGKIMMSQGVSIEKKSLNEVYSALHDVAFDLWKSFFTAYNILRK
ncbi:hypothetical protein EBR43_13280 [bacterium]|nr:hypothetical protein [bacterium]